jgi:hypothetical protein
MTPNNDFAGPGTNLKKILAFLGFTPGYNCACPDHEAEMNAKGADWCEANIDAIVGWLADAAKERKSPFLPLIAKGLIMAAIAKSRLRLTAPPKSSGPAPISNLKSQISNSTE